MTTNTQNNDSEIPEYQPSGDNVIPLPTPDWGTLGFYPSPTPDGDLCGRVPGRTIVFTAEESGLLRELCQPLTTSAPFMFRAGDRTCYAYRLADGVELPRS